MNLLNDMYNLFYTIPLPEFTGITHFGECRIGNMYFNVVIQFQLPDNILQRFIIETINSIFP